MCYLQNFNLSFVYVSGSCTLRATHAYKNLAFYVYKNLTFRHVRYTKRIKRALDLFNTMNIHANYKP